MKLLLVSDLHSSALAIETIARAVEGHAPDAVLVAGDLTMFGPAGYVDEVSLIGETPVLAVTGNCVNAGPAMDGHAALLSCDKGKLDTVLL